MAGPDDPHRFVPNPSLTRDPFRALAASLILKAKRIGETQNYIADDPWDDGYATALIHVAKDIYQILGE